MGSYFRLSPDDVLRLVAEPESGMGFQVILAELSSGLKGRFIVLSSLILLPARDTEELQNSLLSLLEVTDHEDDDLDEVDAKIVSLCGTVKTIESRLQAIDVQAYSQPPLFPKTALVVTRNSANPQLFVRYSARKSDPRVNPTNGNYLPRTYAAPWSEIPLVPSGFAAVGRFALPNPFAARRVYPIVTDSTPQLIGAVPPNKNQAGGGVEVLFPNGATARHGTPHVIPAY